MIARTLLEWQALPYGRDPLDPTTIPERVADRIAQVARASPLAGHREGGVLEHRRHDLRARSVVGVIAAEGATLEILPKICFLEETPEGSHRRIRRQLIHMLGVAFDLRVEPGEIASLGTQDETLLELLIGLFVGRLADAVRRGLPRAYLRYEDDLPALRGRLDLTRQFTRHAAEPSRLACRYDALTHDVALNRMMKAVVARLTAIARRPATQRSLRELSLVYADVAAVPASGLRFDDVAIDRTNERWRGLLALARLLLGGRYQTTSGGAAAGFSLLFEMNLLFESYVTAMLRRALAGSGLTVSAQDRRFSCLTDCDKRLRFQVRPDVVVRAGDRTVAVIDTKWKRISARIDDPKQGVTQADVYQMMAYGRLYRCPRLMLLYPHHDELPPGKPSIDDYVLTHSDDVLTVASLDVGSLAATLQGLATLTGTLQTEA